MFVTIAMLNIVYPALLSFFYQTMVIIASVDLLDGPSHYEKVFDFKETPAFNLRFGSFGIDDMNFFMQTASIPLVFCLIILNYFFW